MDTHLPIPLRAPLRSRVRACRSFLLTPGSRPELFPSARTGDAIIVNLESTVAPGDIAISVLQKYFPSELTASGWLPKLKEIIPSYGVSLIEDADLCRQVRAETAAVLRVESIEAVDAVANA